jgi:hypothetical protein
VRLETIKGLAAQQANFPMQTDHPTSTWPEAAAVPVEILFQVDPHLAAGQYTVTLAPKPDPLFEISETRPVTECHPIGTIDVQPLERSFIVPPLQHEAHATFGDVMVLLGYDLQQGVDTLDLSLHWEALQRMGYYKVFVHLYDADTGDLVAQHDQVPRAWTYPTNWWEAGEIVSDEVSLPLEGVPAGDYRLSVGVYEPETGDRLRLAGGELLLNLEEIHIPLPPREGQGEGRSGRFGLGHSSLVIGHSGSTRRLSPPSLA